MISDTVCITVYSEIFLMPPFSQFVLICCTKVKTTYQACTGSCTEWWSWDRTPSWSSCGGPALSSFWKHHRWKWSWWAQRIPLRWNAWSTALGSWHLWRPAPDRIYPTTGRSTAGTQGSRGHCLWGDNSRRNGKSGSLHLYTPFTSIYNLQSVHCTMHHSCWGIVNVLILWSP